VLGYGTPRDRLRTPAIGTILRSGRARLALAERMSGVGIRYAARSRRDHDRAGRRMPDVDCAGRRLYEELRDGRFVLITRDAVAVAHPAVKVVRCGEARGPAMIRVRTDGYVAWAAETAPARRRGGRRDRRFVRHTADTR
jgi:hypothetical protein